MKEYVEVPDGLIRKDLIKQVIKYERDRYEGGTYYGIKIVEEETHHYENLDRGGAFSNGQKQKRDETYENIKKQLMQNEPEEV
ncbi:MAG: hypothetical protein K6B70_01140 [Clostridia bacterium]|nr:hypothetical protein [Clostridia bacterium]